LKRRVDYRTTAGPGICHPKSYRDLPHEPLDHVVHARAVRPECNGNPIGEPLLGVVHPRWRANENRDPIK
jgi:hypothetical protein